MKFSFYLLNFLFILFANAKPKGAQKGLSSTSLLVTATKTTEITETTETTENTTIDPGPPVLSTSSETITSTTNIPPPMKPSPPPVPPAATVITSSTRSSFSSQESQGFVQKNNPSVTPSPTSSFTPSSSSSTASRSSNAFTLLGVAASALVMAVVGIYIFRKTSLKKSKLFEKRLDPDFVPSFSDSDKYEPKTFIEKEVVQNGEEYQTYVL